MHYTRRPIGLLKKYGQIHHIFQENITADLSTLARTPMNPSNTTLVYNFLDSYKINPS